MLKNNERFDDLELDGLKVIQSKNGYCFTSDSVLLANFVSAKPKDFCVELGAGSGIISLLVQHKNNVERILAFEIQTRLADMAARSVEFNKKSEYIKIINDDMKNHSNYFTNGKADVIFSNPPYRKTDIASENEELRVCRHEIAINLKDLCKTARDCLRTKGKFFIVYDASRTAELISTLKEFNLEPKRMFFTQPAPNKNAVLVIIESIKCGNEGIVVLPTLITNDKNGDYIYTIQNLYRK